MANVPIKTRLLPFSYEDLPNGFQQKMVLCLTICYTDAMRSVYSFGAYSLLSVSHEFITVSTAYLWMVGHFSPSRPYFNRRSILIRLCYRGVEIIAR